MTAAEQFASSAVSRLEILYEHECLQLLGREPIGRIADAMEPEVLLECCDDWGAQRRQHCDFDAAVLLHAFPLTNVSRRQSAKDRSRSSAHGRRCRGYPDAMPKAAPAPLENAQPDFFVP